MLETCPLCLAHAAYWAVACIVLIEVHTSYPSVFTATVQCPMRGTAATEMLEFAVFLCQTVRAGLANTAPIHGTDKLIAS